MLNKFALVSGVCQSEVFQFSIGNVNIVSEATIRSCGGFSYTLQETS